MAFFFSSQRLRDMTSAVEEIAGGDLHKKLPALSGDSIDRLAAAINHLVRSLRERVAALEQ